MHFDNLACIKVKKGESYWFRMNSGVMKGCVMSPWLFNVYMDTVMKEVKMGMGSRKGESGDYLVSCIQMIWFCVGPEDSGGMFC